MQLRSFHQPAPFSDSQEWRVKVIVAAFRIRITWAEEHQVFMKFSANDKPQKGRAAVLFDKNGSYCIS